MSSVKHRLRGCIGILGGCLLAATGAPAAATEAVSIDEEDPTERDRLGRADDGPPRSSFMTLDRVDRSGRFGVQTSIQRISQPRFDQLDPEGRDIRDGFGFRFNVFGQGRVGESPIRLYGQFAVSGFNPNGRPAIGGFGNVEGGMYGVLLGAPDIIIRAGINLPVASSGDGFASNIGAGLERLTDLMGIAPAVLRFSLSTVRDGPAVFVRVDAGLDALPVSDTGPVLRGNAAIGVHAGAVDITTELTNLWHLSSPGERLLHTAALGLRSRGANQAHLGLVLPLDHIFRGEVVILSLGYQRAM